MFTLLKNVYAFKHTNGNSHNYGVAIVILKSNVDFHFFFSFIFFIILNEARNVFPWVHVGLVSIIFG